MALSRCARCGEDWVQGFDRCWNCGYDQAVTDAASPSELLACSSCQSPVTPGDRYCSECGTPIRERTTAFAPMLPPDELYAPSRRFGLRGIGLVLVAVAVLVASVYSVRPALNRDRTIVGSLTLYHSELETVGTACAGSGEYDDLVRGGTVTVRDGDGDTIAVGLLDQSSWFGPAACRFHFVVRDVPRASVYTFEVNDRGRVQFTRDQLEDANWRIYLIAGQPPRF